MAASSKNESREGSSKAPAKNEPVFQCLAVGTWASLSTKEDQRTPLFLSEIEYGLTSALIGKSALVWPVRWCRFERADLFKNIIMLAVEGISLQDFEENISSFEFINNTFQTKLDIITPLRYNGNLTEDLVIPAVINHQKKRLVKAHGSLQAAELLRRDVCRELKAFFPIQEAGGQGAPLPPAERLPRSSLLLSASQMLEHKFPVPLKERFPDFIFTKDVYQAVSPASPMFGLDCEMCVTTEGREVTRISLVNEMLEVLYESYVKPRNKIEDYRTEFSGITEETLKNITVRLEDVQKAVTDILPADGILVGHSLNSDLLSLKMMHPFVIDTSVVYNLTGYRNKSKLSDVVRKVFREDIQSGFHCSTEDSTSAMKLVQRKLTRGIDYENAVLQWRKKKSKQVNLTAQSQSRALSGSQLNNEVAVVTLSKRFAEYKGKHGLRCSMGSTNEDVVQKACKVLPEHRFVLAHVLCGKDDAAQVDSMSHTLWHNAPLNSLCAVLLCGRKGENGVCCFGVTA